MENLKTVVKTVSTGTVGFGSFFASVSIHDLATSLQFTLGIIVPFLVAASVTLTIIKQLREEIKEDHSKYLNHLRRRFAIKRYYKEKHDKKHPDKPPTDKELDNVADPLDPSNM